MDHIVMEFPVGVSKNVVAKGRGLTRIILVGKKEMG